MLVDATLPVPASLMRLLAGLAPLFTAPSFRTFCGLACGFLAQTGATTGYLDTGTNGIYFLSDSDDPLPACPDSDSDFSCPPATVALTATNRGNNGTAAPVTFNVANAEALFATPNAAFNDLSGPDTGDFDWGLPFFYRRNVFTAIEGKSTPGGAGPYWAY